MPASRQLVMELLLRNQQFKAGISESIASSNSLKQNLEAMGKLDPMARVQAGLVAGGKALSSFGSQLTHNVTLPILAVGGAAVKAASDLGESVNAVNVVFGESADTIHDWGETAAESAGISQRAFNEAATVLGSSLKNAGFDLDEVADKTITLTQRAADMASVFNTSVDDALGAIQAALRGETDPIEKFGVSLSAAAVDAKAAALGYKAVGGEFDATAKAAARLAIIMEQTQQVAGDFANTSDSLANRTRTLRARLEDTAAELGEALLPVAEDLAGVLLDLVEGFNDLDPAIQKNVVRLGALAAAAGPVLSILGRLAVILGGTATGAGALIVGAAALELKLRSFGGSLGGVIGGVFDLAEGTANLLRRFGVLAEAPVEVERWGQSIEDSMLRSAEALATVRGAADEAAPALRERIVPAAREARDEFARYSEVEWDAWVLDPLNKLATSPAPDQLVVLREAAATARDPIKKLGDALREAAAQQRSLASAILEFLNPIAAASGALQRLADAQDQVDDLQKRGKDGTEEWAEALLGLAIAKSEAQAALDSLSAQGIESSAAALARVLQIPREEAQLLLETLGLIDGKTVTAVIDIKVPRDVAAILEGLSGEVVNLGGEPQVRQHGGPVRPGEPYLVGEAGPELFVPSFAGNVVPINRAPNSRSTQIHIHQPRSYDLVRDLQVATIMASVTTMVESA